MSNQTTQSVRDQKYSYNGDWVSFHILPQKTQEAILLAEDFFTKLDTCETEDERSHLLSTHPYNQ